MKADDSIDPVDALLLRIAAGAGSALTHDLARLGGAGWTKLAHRAITFRLGPLLSQSIREQRWPAPRQVQSVLERDCREHALRALSQRRTAASLARRMNDLGAAHVVLKGGALVLGQPAHRPSTRVIRDLDVLLSPVDAAALHADLRAGGWSVPPGYVREADPDSHHLPALADPENGNIVELHIRLTKADWRGGDVLAERILRDAVPASCLGETIRIADPASNFLHLIAHATLNRPFDPGPQFLADSAGLVRDAGIDPETFRDQAEALGLGRALALAAALIDHLGGLDDDRWRGALPPDTAGLIDASLAALLQRQDRDRELRFRENIAESGSLAAWLASSAARALSPRAEALAAIAGREPDDPLRYLAYPRWIVQRIWSMAKAKFDPGIGRETRRADALRHWLAGDAEGERR